MRVCSIALLALAASVAVETGRVEPAPVPPTRTVADSRSTIRFPIAFEENAGRTDASVRFVARAPGCRLFVRDADAVLALRGGVHSVRIAFDGGRAAGVDGADRLPGVVHSYVGRDPSRWRTNLPTFARVRQRGVWEGIDVEWYGAGSRIECDFVVAPGADPGDVRLRLDGASRPESRPDGSLVFRAGEDRLRLPPPVVYSVAEGARRPVVGGYVVTDDGAVAFGVGARDRSLPLVIDPVIEFSTFVGGSADDAVGGMDAGRGSPSSVAVPDGTLWVIGTTSSADLPVIGAAQDARRGPTDAFLVRLDPATSTVATTTYFGGKGDEVGAGAASIVRSSFAGVYVTGTTTSDDLPVTAGAFQTSRGGLRDAFLGTFDNGGALRQLTYYGGSGDDVATCISATEGPVDRRAIGGWTDSADLPLGSARFDTTLRGPTDGFVCRLDGSKLLAHYVGGSGDDAVTAIISTEYSGETVAGWTTSDDLQVTDTAFQKKRAGGRDAFVGQASDADDAGWFGASYLGGSADDEATGVDLARPRHVVCGSTRSDDFPTRSPRQAERAGGEDAFVATGLLFAGDLHVSTYLGGSGDDRAVGVRLRPYKVVTPTGPVEGVLHVAGTTASADFPTLGDGQATFGGGATDAFVAQMASFDGSAIAASYLGGSGDDAATALEVTRCQAVAASAPVHVGGTTTSSDFPLTGPTDGSHAGPSEGFVARFPAVGVAPTPRPTTPTIDLRVRSGRVSDKAIADADRLVLTARFSFRGSSDGEIDPRTEAVRVEVGDPGQPLVVAIPAGSPLWTGRGRVHRIRTILSTGERVRLTITVPSSRREGALRLVAKRCDFPAAPANPLLVRLIVGDDLGEESRAWRKLARPGGYRLR